MMVSVIIVCLNEEACIGAAIESLLAQTYERDLFEILVVDNGSSDATPSIVAAFMSRVPTLRWVTNPSKGIAISRNVGLREARHPYVAFIDADCIAPSTWLAGLVEGFVRHQAADPGIVAVGGANVAPAGISLFYDAINVATKTFLGNRGSTQGREYVSDKVVDHMPTLNILYRKDVVAGLGGFDERFRFVCEDPDLNYRLTAAGWRIVYLKDRPVVHAFAPGLRRWARKMFTYGRGRTQLLRKHPHKFGPVYLVPPLLALAWPLASLAPLGGEMLVVPLAGYLVAVFLYSCYHCGRQGKGRVLLMVFLLYVVTHAMFGWGQLWGLWRPQPAVVGES